MTVISRAKTAIDILGHPRVHRDPEQQPPVQSDIHFRVLAFTEFDGVLVPTEVEWRHGEQDRFCNRQKSCRNRQQAINIVENRDNH